MLLLLLAQYGWSHPRGLTRLSGEIHSGYLSVTVVAERWALSCHSVDDTPEVFLISS